jgi:serine/threonine protein kinase
MEYLPHGDLHKYLSSPLPETDAQHIVSQILEGLDFMHENGFAHRDLKPAVSLTTPLLQPVIRANTSMYNEEYTGCLRRPRLVGKDCRLWH